MMFIGFEVVLLMPAPVGVAAAVSATEPRFDGRQLQVAEKLELDPVASLFLQPGKTLPLTLNVTLDATLPKPLIVYPANTTYTINVSQLNYTKT